MQGRHDSGRGGCSWQRLRHTVVLYLTNTAPWLAQGGVKVVEAVLGRLLMAAVADISLTVRRTVLETFKDTTALDAVLAQADR